MPQELGIVSFILVAIALYLILPSMTSLGAQIVYVVLVILALPAGIAGGFNSGLATFVAIGIGYWIKDADMNSYAIASIPWGAYIGINILPAFFLEAIPAVITHFQTEKIPRVTRPIDLAIYLSSRSSKARRLAYQRLAELDISDRERAELVIKAAGRIENTNYEEFKGKEIAKEQLLEVVKPIRDQQALFTLYESVLYPLLDDYVAQKLFGSFEWDELDRDRITKTIDTRIKRNASVDEPARQLLIHDYNAGVELIERSYPLGLVKAEAIEGLEPEQIAALIEKRLDVIASSDRHFYSDVLDGVVKLPAALVFPILTRIVVEAPSRSTLEMDIKHAFHTHMKRKLIRDNAHSNLAEPLRQAVLHRQAMHNPGTHDFENLEVLARLLRLEE